MIQSFAILLFHCCNDGETGILIKKYDGETGMDMDIKWGIRQFAYDLVKMNFFIVAYGALGLGNSGPDWILFPVFCSRKHVFEDENRKHISCCF